MLAVTSYKPQVELPLEVIGLIFNSLEEDLCALKRCSLVCRAWAVCTRLPLFRTLSISNRNTTKILISPNLRQISTYVRRVEIRDQVLSHEESLSTHATFRMLGCFVTLRNITELLLDNVLFDYFIDLTRLLSMFSRLGSLKLRRVKWTDSSLTRTNAEISNGTYDRLPPLSRLEVQGCDLRTFFAWAVDLPQILKLSHFSAGPVNEFSGPFIGPFLVRNGKKVESVSYGFSRPTDAIEQMRSFSYLGTVKANDDVPQSLAHQLRESFGLEPCPYLQKSTTIRTLRIQNFIDTRFTHQNITWTWVPTLITSVRTLEVRRIIFGIHLQRSGELDRYNIKWDFYDKILTSEQYGSLSSVEFEVDGRANLDGVSSLLSLRLPKVASSNLLYVTRMKRQVALESFHMD